MDPSQSSDGAELSLRTHGRKSIGEPHAAHDLRLWGGGGIISHAPIRLTAEAAGQPDHDAANINFLRCSGKSSVDLSLCGRGGVCETEAILKLISSVHEGCDLPVQTFSLCPCFRHKW